MTEFLYRSCYRSVVLPLLRGGFYLSSFVSDKSRQGVHGRKDLIARVREFRLRCPNDRVLLMHCASAGELESLKPIVERLEHKNLCIAVSYFSPSAEHAAREYKGFDFADFPPYDSSGCVLEYLKELRPSAVAISKHDVWPNFVWCARDLGIPIALINGNFPTASLRLHPLLAGFHRTVYGALTEILTVSPEDAERVKKISQQATNIFSAGDTRFDQVHARIAEQRPLPSAIERFAENSTVLLAGSTHLPDERMITAALPDLFTAFPDFRVIFVPHDPGPHAVNRIWRLVTAAGLSMTDIDHPEVERSLARILLVNRKGLLADTYRLASIAFVGGAFGKGVHSVIEPMAAGVPVLCGPRIGVSHEARQALRRGILRLTHKSDELAVTLNQWLSARDVLAKLRSDALSFVRAHLGATETIAKSLQRIMNGKTNR